MSKWIERGYYQFRAKELVDLFGKYKSLQWQPLEDNIAIQREQLFSIIDYCVKYVPYYQELNRQQKFIYSRQTIMEDIRHIPFMTKATLRNHFDEMQPARQISDITYVNSSGGSTGEPAKIIQDHAYKQGNKAGAFLFDSWSGWDFGEKMVRLWGSARDLQDANTSLKNKVINRMFPKKLLNSFRMSEPIMDEYINYINRYKPRTIVAYVDSMYDLSRFINRNKLTVYSPEAIIVSAGTLFPYMQEEIESAFHSILLNRYGSREVGPIASSCPKQEGLHVNIFNNFIEIVDENGKPCKDGDEGEIVVTSLINYAMPLIRYKIGDRGVWSAHQCSCGRGMPLLDRVVGRVSDVFVNTKGEQISGTFLTTTLGYYERKDFIKKFQIVQKSLDLIQINIECDSMRESSEGTIDSVKQRIKDIFGDDCRIEICFMDEIPVEPSGKFRYIKSEIFQGMV